MTPEEVELLAAKIAKLLADRGWVPETVRPSPPDAPSAESLPAWAAAAQGLEDVAPVVGRRTPTGEFRPAYDSLTVAARAAAAGTGPSPLPGGAREGGFTAAGEVDIKVAVSARHLHISHEDFDALFGPEAKLTVEHPISQPGQFAAEQQVRIVGPKGVLEDVRIVGPPRSHTQVELAASEYRALGIEAPLRHSGDLGNSAPVRVEGPAGNLDLEVGAIVTARHLHLGLKCAARLGLSDGDRVNLEVGSGERRCLLHDVPVRAGEEHATELHIDTDEASAFGVSSGSPVKVVGEHSGTPDEPSQAKSCRRLITERDVSAIAAEGVTLECCKDYLVTPAARDRAKALGIWRSGT